MFKCRFIGEAMSVKKIIFILIFLIPHVIISQDFLNINKLKTLSDEQVLNYWSEAQSSGYSMEQIKTTRAKQTSS